MLWNLLWSVNGGWEDVETLLLEMFADKRGDLIGCLESVGKSVGYLGS